MKNKIHFIHLKNVPIFEQLMLEEALLRTDERSFCIVNMGSPRAIVMGISGQPDLLLDVPKVNAQKIPVIRRFSGGGTVIVDENTLFITFVMAKEHLDLPPYPEPILRWSNDLYTSAWKIREFQLRENDYCIGKRKCGGNAHYMRKTRWIHHTSFLWDYDQENMDLLLLPAKRPAYREKRSHEEFLCRLRDYGSTPEMRLEEVRETLVKLFYIQDFDPSSLEKKPHRQATSLINLR
jgi:lipoate-protein ligase A